MSKSSGNPLLTHFGMALLFCATSMLTACQADDPADYVDPQASAFYDRYPIKVKSAPVKMGIATHGDMLLPGQIDAVSNFASDALNNSSSKVTIRWPSGSAKMRQMAMDIAQTMVEQGLPESMIGAGSYPGGASAPIQLSFQRKVAVTKECGDWSENLASTSKNTAYPNFGCSYQNNVAALVANPEDFEHPRPVSPIVAANRTAAMVIYYNSPTVITATSKTDTQIKNGTVVTTSSGN